MMSNEPPQGAHSADPVREAAQALIDATDTIVPEHLTATEAMDWCEIDNAKIDAAWDALRTALAAPEGPAPTDTARNAARYLMLRHAIYMSDGRPIPMLAQHRNGKFLGTYEMLSGERLDEVCDRYATPEAPPPVEARQPPEPDFEKWWESWPFANAKDPRTKGVAHHAWRAALAAPAGAGEREALRELIAACDAQDEWRMTPTSLRMNLSAVEAYDIGNRVDLAWTAARAALSVSPPGPEIQPPLDHQVGAPVTQSDAANPWCWYCGSSEPTCQKPFDDVPCRRSKQGNGGGL